MFDGLSGFGVRLPLIIAGSWLLAAGGWEAGWNTLRADQTGSISPGLSLAEKALVYTGPGR